MNHLISKKGTDVLPLLLSFCVLFFLTAGGCSKAPDGFPKTVSCTVTVTDEGKPIEGAFVLIEAVPPTPSLSVSAQTDSQGKAVMQTFLGSYAEWGVPVGKLIMTLQKEPEVVGTKSNAELEKMGYEKAEAYQNELNAKRAKAPKIIPPALRDTANSPLTMDAVAGKSIQWNVKLEEYKK
jgi:hypothetical protein